MTSTVQNLLRPEPHPMLPPRTLAESIAIERALLTAPPEKARALAEQLARRAARIAQAEADPMDHGWEPDSWTLADSQLEAAETLAVFGGNRTSKSWWAGRRFCEAAWNYPGGTLVALSAKEETSIATQQKIVWHYLRPRIEHINLKRSPGFKINYTQANGFSDGKVVLPNGRNGREGTEIYFFTYKQIATDYEGWEFGAVVEALTRRGDGRPIRNIGWWADESLTLSWLEVLTRRAPFRKAKGLWTFTPVRGITPAIKQFLGKTMKVLTTAPAELLPAANVEGCPRGHMPVTVEPWFKKSRAVYFHLGANPFGGYTQEVRNLCVDKSTDYIECVAYGFARESVANAFPDFGPWNIIDEADLPAVGTNYQLNDPHDARAWFSLWVRVTNGTDGPEFYIYRDWPDEQTYGEWAVPTERETNDDTTKGWDGDPGPAQWARVNGITGYKRIWRDAETLRGGGEIERDPYRRKLQEQAEKSGVPVREEIRDRYIDSRAGPRPHLEEFGATCVVLQFAESHHDTETGAELPPVDFLMVSGERIDLNLLREMIAPQRDREGRIVRPPRLFVSRRCRQVIWALANYTGKAGEKGACKDPIDCLRYLVNADLAHEPEGSTQCYRPGVEEDENE